MVSIHPHVIILQSISYLSAMFSIFLQVTAPLPTEDEDAHTSMPSPPTEEAANLIQKLYRGHNTRMALDECDANETTRAIYSSLMSQTETHIKNDGRPDAQEDGVTSSAQQTSSAGAGVAGQGSLKPLAGAPENKPKEMIDEVLKMLDRALEGSGKESGRERVGQDPEQRIEDHTKRENSGSMARPHGRDLQSKHGGKHQDLYELTDSDEESEAGKPRSPSQVPSSTREDPSPLASKPPHVGTELTPTLPPENEVDKDVGLKVEKDQARAIAKKFEKVLEIAEIQDQMDAHSGISEPIRRTPAVPAPLLPLYPSAGTFRVLEGGGSHKILQEEKTEEAPAIVLNAVVPDPLSVGKSEPRPEGKTTSAEVEEASVPRELPVDDDVASVSTKPTGRPVGMKKLDLRAEVLDIAAAEIQRIFRGHSSRKSSVDIKEDMLAQLSKDEKNAPDTPQPSLLCLRAN